jgi:hypothetical protein
MPDDVLEIGGVRWMDRHEVVLTERTGDVLIETDGPSSRAIRLTAPMARKLASQLARFARSY